MEDILFWIANVFFIISFFVLLSFNIHMYQLNHYKNKVQINWIKKNIKKLFIKSGILFIALILFFCGIVGKIIGIMLFLLVAYINRPKDIKKPLVYTNRVKRLIATTMLLALILICTAKFIGISNEIIFCIMVMLDILVPILIFILDFLNIPINRVINNYYINDAKKIINNMPNLIVIGVTGSYGKTSVKNFLNKFLSTKYNVLATPENYNTLLGVVKTIRNNLKATHEIFICEMGAGQVRRYKRNM